MFLEAGFKKKPRKKQKPPTKTQVYQLLAEKFRWTPKQIAELTPAQQLAMLQAQVPDKFESLAAAKRFCDRASSDSPLVGLGGDVHGC
jgi:hypothetical protein